MKKSIVIVTLLCLGFASHAQNNMLVQPQENSTEPLKVVSNFLTAYQEGDHERISLLLHPDVIWIQPGQNRISGVKKSKAELLQMGATMAALSAGTLKLTRARSFGPAGSTVVCLLHWEAAQPTGNVLDVDHVDVYTVEYGKIVSVKIFSEDIAKEDLFWGK